jgi:prophage DNA circulation protein
MTRNLKRMSFKEYTWPYNPETYVRNNDKNLVTHEYPDIDGGEIEELGVKPRIISGSGTFHGEHAYSNYKYLESIYRKKEPGYLVHPIYGKMKCTFSKLNVRHEPLPNFVQYDFEFIEYKDINVVTKVTVKNNNNSNSSSNSTRYYTVKKGDNLWNISKKYYGRGIDYKKIANANKKLIKNPNLIYPGWKLIIP